VLRGLREWGGLTTTEALFEKIPIFAIMWVFQEMKQPALSGNGTEIKANLRQVVTV